MEGSTHRQTTAPLNMVSIFSRRMLPLAVFTGIFVTVALPLAHYMLKRSDLASQGALHADRVATAVKELIDQRPEYWRFDAAKLGRIIMPYRQKGVDDVRVLDWKGTLLLSTAGDDGVGAGTGVGAEAGAGIRAIKQVLSNNRTAAVVEVVMDTRELHSTTGWLLGVCGIVGIMLGSTLYRIPVITVRKSQRRIVDAMGALEQARRENAISLREEERRRISRELHDGVAQRLTALRIRCELEGLDSISDQVDVMLDELRRLAHDLRPPLLDGPGLGGALRQLAVDYERATGRTCRVCIDGGEGGGNADGGTIVLPRPLETALYRIAQEALANSARHGGGCDAALELKVKPGAGSGVVQMRVEDFGCGFILDDAAPGGKVEDVMDGGMDHGSSIGCSGLELGHGLGLIGMRERASLCGGVLSIRSTPGSGTVVDVTFVLPV